MLTDDKDKTDEKTPPVVTEQNEAFKDLPDFIKVEIRKLGWSSDTFNQHMLEAIKRACAYDCRLVDDHHANPLDLYDMMELTDKEHLQQSGNRNIDKDTYWQDYVTSRQSAEGQRLFTAA